MSTAPQGERLQGELLQGWLQGEELQPQRREADRALAARDPRIPGLNWVLDDELLSELLGERVRITRTRYKPHSSALVVFRRAGNGAGSYGWASTTAPEHAGKLQRRADSSLQRGGGIRLIRPDQLHPDVAVAAGPIEEDWPLRPNLRWLRDHGLRRLGALPAAGRFLDPPVSVLRYNPERRLVARVPTETGPVVIKTAVQADEVAAGLRLRQRLQSHGIPVLPELADPACAAHGISASPGWGQGDLGGGDNDPAAYRAGQAVAAIHGMDAGAGADPMADREDLARQLAATRSMIICLFPGLQAPVDALTGRLLAAVGAAGPQRQQPVLVHGDFSADQVLVDGPAIRIIDFDRVTTSDPARDLGSFAAVEDIADPAGAGPVAGGRKTAQLIDGYREAGGHVTQARVDSWAAFRLFLNSVDPFRNRASDWPADTNWHIRRALELIA
ncbi:phosphotransferase family protein [Arthrobacter sp. 9MFCol3.1]|uniref:phosphotransferase family protein n=1 Tax=Arthrobacter sp. 9MFCol3.1 TaxID=1150398 RepID=UPI00047B294A|nr:aminoglycoside phosphotransferase family protein [Arthrobacter sp. 9MFCol3.1]